MRRIPRDRPGIRMVTLPIYPGTLMLVLGNTRSGKTDVVRRSIEREASDAPLKAIVLTRHPSHWVMLARVGVAVFVDEQNSDVSYQRAFDEAAGYVQAHGSERLIFILDGSDTAKDNFRHMLSVLEEMQVTAVVLRSKLSLESRDHLLLSRFDRVAIFRVNEPETHKCLRLGHPEVEQQVLKRAAQVPDGEFVLL